MAKRAKKEEMNEMKGGKKDDDSKLFAFLAVFLTIIGFIIALAVKKDNRYVMYYAKQGLVLFIAWAVVWVAAMIFVFIPIFGWLVMMVLYLGMLVLWVIGIVNSLSGQMKPVPVIGQFADNINI